VRGVGLALMTTGNIRSILSISTRGLLTKGVCMVVKYMHTLNGHPATYHGEEQVCYGGGRGKYQLIHLADSLAQIKIEQKMSMAWRKKMKFVDCKVNYSYVRLEV